MFGRDGRIYETHPVFHLSGRADKGVSTLKIAPGDFLNRYAAYKTMPLKNASGHPNQT